VSNWREPCPDCGAWGAHYCTGGQEQGDKYVDEDNWWNMPCTHREHNPPSHLSITSKYTHTCPGCGHKITVYPKRFIC
jgi:predicted RNA-binding Zn-ribbon protein involved in translation (DUF1610 family)